MTEIGKDLHCVKKLPVVVLDSAIVELLPQQFEIFHYVFSY